MPKYGLLAHIGQEKGFTLKDTRRSVGLSAEIKYYSDELLNILKITEGDKNRDEALRWFAHRIANRIELEFFNNNDDWKKYSYFKNKSEAEARMQLANDFFNAIYLWAYNELENKFREQPSAIKQFQYLSRMVNERSQQSVVSVNAAKHFNQYFKGPPDKYLRRAKVLEYEFLLKLEEKTGSNPDDAVKQKASEPISQARDDVYPLPASNGPDKVEDTRIKGYAASGPAGVIDFVNTNSGKRVKDKYTFDLIMQYLYEMRDDYQELKRSTHLVALNKLINDLEKNVVYSNDDYEKKITIALNKIVAAFKVAQDDYQAGFITSRTKDEFIERVNSKLGAYHYPRMLAMLTRKVYNDFPELKNTRPADRKYSETEKVMAKINEIPPKPQYDKYVAGLTTSYRQSFKDFTDSLKEQNFSDMQLYHLYHNTTKLDLDLAKKLWPELKTECHLSDRAIRQLLDGAHIEITKADTRANIGKFYKLRSNLRDAGIAGGPGINSGQVSEKIKAAVKALDRINHGIAIIQREQAKAQEYQSKL